MDHFANGAYEFEVTDTPAPGGSDNSQTVVLLHGFPEDRHSWAAIAGPLAAAGYRILAPDQRGYSPAARPPARRDYRLRDLASDVLAMADAAGLHRFHLVGHDWGAGLAWHIAGSHPDRLLSLAALSVPHPEAFLRSLTRSDQALRSWYMAAFQLPKVPEWIFARHAGDALRANLMRSGLDAATARRYATRAADPAAMRGPINWYRALPYAVRQRTGTIELPTLFVWGDRDRYIGRTAAELCGRYVTGPFRFEVLAGASHWLLQECPDQVAALLTQHFGNATPR